MRRSSWLDVLASTAGFEEPFTSEIRSALIVLDEALFDFWHLGEKIVLAWSREQDVLRFLGIPHYELMNACRDTYMNGLLSAAKFLSPAEFDKACEALEDSAQTVAIKAASASDIPAVLIDSLVMRYGVTLVREGAVVLLDAVGFSLRSTLEQVAMLNSLSYSLNSACNQLNSKDVQINIGRSTTGDGFYVWNRAKTPGADTALYKLMILLLADNAVAHSNATDSPVPRLRAAFHIGEHYEFYQVESLNPTTIGYVTGPVTIELARMLSKAPAGQIVIGKFRARSRGDDHAADTMKFVEETASTLNQLSGLVVAGDRIKHIRCYLTGPRVPAGQFAVASYDIKDKHGIRHSVYNAKINIYLQRGVPIFLGLQHKEVDQLRSDDQPSLPVPADVEAAVRHTG